MSTPHLTLEINPGRHSRGGCPMTIHTADAAIAPVNTLLGDDGSTTLLQMLNDGQAAFILDHADPFHSRRYSVAHAENPCQPGCHGMEAVEESAGTISILQDGNTITRYHFDSSLARPYFFPVNEPGGACVTRSYPMQTVAHETSDHPHHRSLWIAHGDVNGTDNWSEEPGHGHTRHLSIDSIENGPVVCRISTTSLWTDRDDAPLLTQRLRAWFWRSVDRGYTMDFEIDLAADQTDADLVFADTKEGGILSIRVASSMDATRGGDISNVYGGRDESECWGKHSHWCSYSGVVEHKPCGIAVFDHPDGFRSPTTWHVRDYGLMTANPFGYAAFTHGRMDGTCVLPAGETLQFRYRVVAHSDPAFNASCSARYLNYAFPPRATLSYHAR